MNFDKFNFDRTYGWFKRNWVVAVLILFLLWKLPTFLSSVVLFVPRAIVAISSVFGAKVAQTVANLIQPVVNWILEHAWFFSLIVFFFFPVAGAFLQAWLVLDHWKTGGDLVPSPAPPSSDSNSDAARLDPYIERLFGIGKGGQS